MAGYIGSKASVTQVDGYNRAEADAEFVDVTGDTMTGALEATNLTRGGSQVFSRDNILGTVSESSGVPTGAIIERGSNANGEYVKYADGTMICTVKRTFTETASGSRLDTPTWTYPKAFSAAPNLHFSALATTGTSGSGRWVDGNKSQEKVSFIGGSPNASSASSLRIWSIFGQTFSSGETQDDVSITAIGRWF